MAYTHKVHKCIQILHLWETSSVIKILSDEMLINSLTAYYQLHRLQHVQMTKYTAYLDQSKNSLKAVEIFMQTSR